MSNEITRFLSVSRVQEKDDGTATFTGIAASDALCDDGVQLSKEALEECLPRFLVPDPSGEKSAPLRVAHDPARQVGKIRKASVTDGGLMRVEGLVVEPLAVKLLRAGVFRQLSLRARILERDPAEPSIARKIDPIECSLCDRGLDPAARIEAVRSLGRARPPATPLERAAEDVARFSGTPWRKRPEAAMQFARRHCAERWR